MLLGTEGSHSGLVRTPGKCVCRKVSRVRIPHPPPEFGIQIVSQLIKPTWVPLSYFLDRCGKWLNRFMKAIICKKYGPPEVLQIEEVPKPIPKDSEIVVKIVATTVNSGDVRVRALRVEGFMKIVMRLVLGFSKPRKPVLGTVFAGIVESVGNKVTHFKIGDRVFGATGFKFGTYAEYIAVDEKSEVVMMPHNASFDEAAAIVFGG